MEGTVFKIVSGIHDNTPFSGNYPYNTGNTVVIRNKDYYFLLGHLKFESFQVQEGERIERGQDCKHWELRMDRAPSFAHAVDRIRRRKLLARKRHFNNL